jgi:4-amino-4-deoxy-L-arabinose transferase-like glycosyltransferase
MPSGPGEDGGTAPARRFVRPALRGLLRHAGFLVLLLLGAAARGLAVHAYVPAFFFPDSASYLHVAHSGVPDLHRTWGYSAFLAVLERLVPFGQVVVVQHLLGLLAAVLVYALLQRRGVRRSVSCLAAAPLLLDGYVVQIEHYVMAESLYILLLAAAIVLLLWQDRLSWWAAAAAGVVLGLGMITRTVGGVVIAVAVLYLLVRLVGRTVRWFSVPAMMAGVGLVVLPYLLWMHGHTGIYGLSDYTGHFLYGRVSSFADCERSDVPSRLRGLCPSEPVGERPNPDFYVWSADSPANSGRYTEDDLQEFAERILADQPWEFVTSTTGRTLDYFLPGRTAGLNDSCLRYWWFPDSDSYEEAGSLDCPAQLARQGFALEPVRPVWDPAAADVLARYQEWVHTPDTVLGVLALAGLSGLVARRRGHGWRDRVDGAFCVTVGVALVALPSATAVYDHRYALPLLVVLPIGAALATRQWLTARPAVEPPSAPRPDPDRPTGFPSRVSDVAATDPVPPAEGGRISA